MFMIGVYWGRFNPPHIGHIALIKKLVKKVDSLIIAIGSAKEKNTKRNPFDGNERKMMLKTYLKDEGIDRVKVICVPDGKSYYSSIKNLIKKCSKFGILFTDKEVIIKEMAKIDKNILVKRIKRTGRISSTILRNNIAKDQKWEHLTGKNVVKIIKRLNGIERIKAAYKKD